MATERRVGAYARLSLEDSRAGESVSIENQKLMLTKHAKEQGWKLVEIYCDDGFSGTNQNRPALQRMLHDIKQGRINTLLVKDLSRLGRNYLEVGNLAEVTLPEYGCELISLNEKIDDMMFIRNWFNEQHSKETSKKVRAVRKIFAENGKHMGTVAPYGYRKNPDNKYQLVIDENTAPIVRKIFGQRLQGQSYRAIAISLNESGIMPPSDYLYEGKNGSNPQKTNHLWSGTAIKRILLSEVYIGNLVQGKKGTISYKDQRLVDKDESEWIRVTDTHEPIITQEMWERIQDLQRKKFKPRVKSNGKPPSIFTGLCYCADCDFKLKNANNRELKNGKYYERSAFICGNYARSGKSACTIHSISEPALIEIVTTQIRTHAKLVQLDEKRIVEEILRQQNAESIATQKAYKGELKAHQKRIDKLNIFIEKLYEDRVNGIVPEDFFRRQLEKYEQERIDRVQTVESLEKKIAEIKLKTNNVGTWARQIKQYAGLETLDSEILLLLVDRIVVAEAQKIDNKRICDVRVFYNYVGNISEIAEIGGAA